jgi:hypothetical protein
VPRREQDTWGVGVFWLERSDEDLLAGLNVENEVGGEVYYNGAVGALVPCDAGRTGDRLRAAARRQRRVLGVRTHFNS